MPEALLVWTPITASIAAVHTLSGPDHYLPFIAMAKAGRWSWSRTAWVTLLCGLGHVASSIVLALLGSLALVGTQRLLGFESFRGDLAAWGLIGFGLVYAVWGFRAARRRRPHRHLHIHEDGSLHEHLHNHTGEHTHVHEKRESTRLTPWILFTIFVLGPCEPLIPLLMFPALKESAATFAYVALLFTLVTVLCMLAVVALGVAGLRRLRLSFVERYAHAYAGLAVFVCGMAIKFLGL
jgi:ABC-type nickel/cobalt efflux system permease component RcnA